MNIPDQFKEVRVFLAQNGFIAVLEKLPVSMMTVILSYCVSGKKPPHDRGNRNKPCSKQNVCMIWKKCPRVASGLRFRQYIAHSAQEIIPVQIILKDPFSLNPSDNDVVESTWRIDSGLSGHTINIPKDTGTVNLIILWTSLNVPRDLEPHLSEDDREGLSLGAKGFLLSRDVKTS